MDQANSPKFLRFWFPVILYSGIIFCASSLPNVKTPLQEIHFDWILHILIYMPFGFLWARAVGNTKPSISRGMLFVSLVLVSFLYGLSDEFHQSFVLGRNAGIDDVIADTIGGVIGGYIYPLLLSCVKGK